MVRTFFFYVECNTKYDKYKLYNYYFCCIFKKMLKYKINIIVILRIVCNFKLL